MNLRIKNIKTEETLNITLPCHEEYLQTVCDRIEVQNNMKDIVEIVKVYDNTKASDMFVGQQVNLDEMNFLAKRLATLSESENTAFYAISRAYMLTSLKDLINTTYNIGCYHTISNFSDLNSLGKLFHATDTQSRQDEVSDSFDGSAYVQNIMQNGNAIITQYGVVYKNSNTEITPYDGYTYPQIESKSVLTLAIGNEGTVDYLYLPCKQSEIDKLMERICVQDEYELMYSMETSPLPENVANFIMDDFLGLEELNQICGQLNPLSKDDLNVFSKLMISTEIENKYDFETLLMSLHEFDMYEGIAGAKEYGYHMICESGFLSERALWAMKRETKIAPKQGEFRCASEKGDYVSRGHNYDENLEPYIDFEKYGSYRMGQESGALTYNGYIVYHGYNPEMQRILETNLGMEFDEIAQAEELRLYMPLKAYSYYDENAYGDLYQVDYEVEIYPEQLAEFKDEIQRALSERMSADESERGLMAYFSGSNIVNAKVKKFVYEVEEVNGKLMGVAVLTLNAGLGENELDEIKAYITGQSSDGFGEGFEQREIHCNGQEVYVSLWNNSNYFLKTADEMEVSPTTAHKWEQSF